MIASGLLLSVASFAFSFARPLDRLSSVLPLSSIFHQALILSVLGQLLIHAGCMWWAVNMAKEYMGEGAVKEVRRAAWRSLCRRVQTRACESSPSPHA